MLTIVRILLISPQQSGTIDVTWGFDLSVNFVTQLFLMIINKTSLMS